MKLLPRKVLTVTTGILFLGVLVPVILWFVVHSMRTATEYVTFYPTYGFRQNGKWIIPLDAWVYQKRPYAEWFYAKVAAFIHKDEADEANGIGKLPERIQDIVADGEHDKEIAVRFDGDAVDSEPYKLLPPDGNSVSKVRTNNHGFARGRIELPEKDAERLLAAQNAQKHRWLAFKVASGGQHDTNRQGVRKNVVGGRVQLIEDATGALSVISDIDDTVKVTGIPKGPDEVLKNTFFREFEAAPGMAKRYLAWAQTRGASFHFVSGGFYQLYEPTAALLEAAGFPEATFHLRGEPKDVATLPGLASGFLYKLLPNRNDAPKAKKKGGTLEFKVSRIKEIMSHFPNRRFILVGDSGEKDPEVFAAVREDAQLNGRIEATFVRDVNEVTKRAKKMTLIDASTGDVAGSEPPQ